MARQRRVSRDPEDGRPKARRSRRASDGRSQTDFPITYGPHKAVLVALEDTTTGEVKFRITVPKRKGPC